jgi:hypothetical protein
MTVRSQTRCGSCLIPSRVWDLSKSPTRAVGVEGGEDVGEEVGWDIATRIGNDRFGIFWLGTLALVLIAVTSCTEEKEKTVNALSVQNRTFRQSDPPNRGRRPGSARRRVRSKGATHRSDVRAACIGGQPSQCGHVFAMLAATQIPMAEAVGRFDLCHVPDVQRRCGVRPPGGITLKRI